MAKTRKPIVNNKKKAEMAARLYAAKEAMDAAKKMYDSLKEEFIAVHNEGKLDFTDSTGIARTVNVINAEYIKPKADMTPDDYKLLLGDDLFDAFIKVEPKIKNKAEFINYCSKQSLDIYNTSVTTTVRFNGGSK